MGLKLTIGRRNDAPPLVETLEDEPPAPVATKQAPLHAAPKFNPEPDMSTDDPEDRYTGPVDPEIAAYFRERGMLDKRLWVVGTLYDRELRRKDAVICSKPDPFPGEPIMFAASVIRIGERLKVCVQEPYPAQREFRQWVIDRHGLTGIR